jgi:hypothetical protein
MPRIFNTDQFGLSGNPFTYKIESIILRNHAGVEREISSIITEFTITESIYRHCLVLKANIKDHNNVMEDLSLIGQEKITVRLTRQGRGEDTPKEINHDFYISEYPLYSKFPNRLQVFSITAVSELAYLSQMKLVTRAYQKQNSLKIVEHILTEYLNVKKESIQFTADHTRNFAGIIPALHPLDAINWVLRRTYGTNDTPIYCFETLAERKKIRVLSHHEMANSKVYRKYADGIFFNVNDVNTAENYLQSQGRIIELASNLNLSKFSSATKGAYASTSIAVDIARKKYAISTFNYLNEFNRMKQSTLEPNPILSSKFTVNEKKLSDFDNTVVRYLPVNSLSQNDDPENYHWASTDSALGRHAAYLENLDTFVHDVRVAGDFGLGAGKVVDLRLVKSMDPENPRATVNNKAQLRDLEDTLMSGKHIITSLTHHFEKDYFCTMRVKRDSLNERL